MKAISEQYKSIIYDTDLRWLKLDINFDDLKNLSELSPLIMILVPKTLQGGVVLATEALT